MAVPLKIRTLLATVAGLCGGVALGAFLPAGTPAATRPTPSLQSTPAASPESNTASQDAPSTGTSSTRPGGEKSLLEFKEFASVGKLPPEKLIALFAKVSNLRSETRKYILAYRLASQMELGQIEGALQSALQDLSDGDYVTTRALARRWVELDPKAAAAKALETKQQHLMIPVMESWARIEPAGPLAWALQQDPGARADAVRPLLMNRLLDQTQLQKLVLNAAASDSDEMRRQIFPFATSRLAETNPQGALHAASSIEDADVRQRTLVLVMGRLAQSAPEVAKTWLAAQQNLPPEQKQQLEQVLANPRSTGGRRGSQ